MWIPGTAQEIGAVAHGSCAVPKKTVHLPSLIGDEKSRQGAEKFLRSVEKNIGTALTDLTARGTSPTLLFGCRCGVRSESRNSRRVGNFFALDVRICPAFFS